MLVNKFRKKIIAACGALEAYISVLIIIAIAVFSINIVIDIINIVPKFFTTDDAFFVQQFLGRSLELVIAIEFVKMIANNTPGSTIEVLIFAIARSIIIGHSTPLHELFFGIAAIAILFAIRKWAHKYDRNIVSSDKKGKKLQPQGGDTVQGKVINANILVSKLNQIIHEQIPARANDTIGLLLSNCLQHKKGHVSIGDQLEIEGVRMIVHSILDGRIDEVEIISEHINYYNDETERAAL